MEKLGNLLNKKNIFKKKKWLWIISTLVVIGIGVRIVFVGKPQTEVESNTVKRGEVKEELILTGRIVAERYASLTFPTSGKISWVGVSEGDVVKQGAALISLDKTTLNSAYMQALNNYRNYQAAAENTLDIVKDKSESEDFATKATRTAAEVARDNAYDSLKAAEYNLKNSTLFAPFAGVVSSLPLVNPGVNVNLGQVLVEIVDPASIYFEVSADQSEVINIKKGQEVSVVLDSFRDRELKGQVVFVGYTPVSGEISIVYKVKVTFDEENVKDIDLRMGMSGDAKFVLSKKEDVLYIPAEYLHADREGKYVKVGKPGNKTRVDVGIEGEEFVEIISGVKEGDVIYD